MNSITEKLITDLLSKYSSTKKELKNPSKENVELEIRYKDITKEAFESVYKGILLDKSYANPVLECSVNVISENIYERNAQRNDETQYIRKLIFNNGKVSSDLYMQKNKLSRNVVVTDYIKYSIGLAHEKSVDSFPTSTNALVRFKLRVSFDFIGSSSVKWRFDLTAIKHGVLSELGASLKKIKTELFTPNLTATTLMQNINFDIIDHYEIEIEYIGKDEPTIDDLLIVKQVFLVLNPKYLNEIAYQEEIYHVAEYIVSSGAISLFKQPTHRLKQLSNQVVQLSKSTYYSDVYPPHGYFLTEKADGVRTLISINGNRCRLIKSDAMTEYFSDDTTIHTPGEVTICDAELITLDSTILKIFEVMVVRDENVSKQGFEHRVGFLPEVVTYVSKYIPSMTIVSAKYVRLDQDKLEDGFREIFDVEYQYSIDGMILTEPGEPYNKTHNYKWKPIEKNTIDFLAISCPKKLLGIKPFEVRKDMDLYILFVGISHQMREKLGLGFIKCYRQMFPRADGGYYPIQFSPSINPLAYLYYHSNRENLNGQIIELGREENNWQFHRIRKDRQLEKNYFGNDFRIAELTYLNYIDPLTLEDLWTPPGSYFTKTSSDIHMAPNKFKRFVISLLLKDNLSGVKWIIDLAAGRGADLHRYQEIGVENALFIDIDPTAITELIQRKFSYFATKKKHIKTWLGNAENTEIVKKYDKIHDIEYDKLIVKDVKSLTVHTLVADLNSPYKDTLASIYQFGINLGIVDGVICNFALHYFCDTLEHIRNILQLCSRVLKVGGLFIFTVMDGKSVFDTLKSQPTGSTWSVKEGEITKYAIKKLYVGDKLTTAGQMISVMLPFSDTMYEEPLCNVDVVISEAEKLGFAVELNSSMTSYMNKFAHADRTLHDRLSPDDKSYISLFKFVSLRLIKEPKN